MQIYDFLYYVVFQYIFLLSIQLLLSYFAAKILYKIDHNLLMSFYISKLVSSVAVTFLRNVLFNIYNYFFGSPFLYLFNFPIKH